MVDVSRETSGCRGTASPWSIFWAYRCNEWTHPGSSTIPAPSLSSARGLDTEVARELYVLSNLDGSLEATTNHQTSSLTNPSVVIRPELERCRRRSATAAKSAVIQAQSHASGPPCRTARGRRSIVDHSGSGSRVHFASPYAQEVQLTARASYVCTALKAGLDPRRHGVSISTGPEPASVRA